MAKRKQVKNACINCQRACKKCDDLRPCSRCVRYGFEGSCVNSRRKERTKRTPYKPRLASQLASQALNDHLGHSELAALKALAYVCSALVMKEEQAGRLVADAAMATLKTWQQQGTLHHTHLDLVPANYQAGYIPSPVPRSSGILTPPATPSDLKLNHCIEFHQSPGLPTVATVVRTSSQE